MVKIDHTVATVQALLRPSRLLKLPKLFPLNISGGAVHAGKTANVKIACSFVAFNIVRPNYERFNL